jgi:hypothetical protein
MVNNAGLASRRSIVEANHVSDREILSENSEVVQECRRMVSERDPTAGSICDGS